MHASLNDNDMHCLLGESHETGQENVMVIFEGYIENPAPPPPKNKKLYIA